MIAQSWHQNRLLTFVFIKKKTEGDYRGSLGISFTEVGTTSACLNPTRGVPQWNWTLIALKKIGTWALSWLVSLLLWSPDGATTTFLRLKHPQLIRWQIGAKKTKQNYKPGSRGWIRSQHPANKSFRRRSVASLKFKRRFQCSWVRSESDVSVAVCKHNMQGFTPPTWLHNSGNAPPQLWLAWVQPQGMTCIPPSPLAGGYTPTV